MAPRGILARPLTTTLIAVMVVGSLVLVGGTANAADSCGYPSGTGRTATVFNESEVLRTFRIDTAKGTIQAFYNDEHALTLGENLNGFSITPFVAAYPKPNTTTKLADDASPVSIGDPNAADPQARPIYPALFLTDITSGPSTSGDWQQQSNNSTAKPAPGSPSLLERASATRRRTTGGSARTPMRCHSSTEPCQRTRASVPKCAGTSATSPG